MFWYNFLMVRYNFAIYIGFAYGTGNQLSILGTEIEDKNFFIHGAAKITFVTFSGLRASHGKYFFLTSIKTELFRSKKQS